MLHVEAGTADPSIPAVSVHYIAWLICRIMYSLQLYLGMSAIGYYHFSSTFRHINAVSRFFPWPWPLGEFPWNRGKIEIKKRKTFYHLCIPLASHG